MRQMNLTTLILLMTCSFLYSQSFSPIAFNIKSPLGVEVDDQGYVWVVEGGSGNDDGQVWRYSLDGFGEVVVTGLPSAFNVATQELQGPLNVVTTDDDHFYIIQGGGPFTHAGTIMEFDLSAYYARGASLIVDDALEIIDVSGWVLANGFAESNPYSFVTEQDGSMIISDAAANAIIRYDNATEQFSILVTFPPSANPLPFGPPFIDAVPTKIMHHPGGGYLVSTLTGFPFVDGSASIYHINEDGTSSVYETGLTLLTDMAIDPRDNELVALQFASFGPMGFEFASAQLVKIHADKSREVMAAGFGPSAGIGIASNGNIYASHLFLGQLLEFARCDVEAGSISTASGRTSLSLCTTDGVPDLFDVKTNDKKGIASVVISDDDGIILNVLDDSRINLEGTGVGLCYVQQLAHDNTLRGLTVGDNIADLTGCFDLSNKIVVDRIDCDGCHVPLNLRYRQRSSNVFQLSWDRVNDSKGYELMIGIRDEPNSFVTIPVRKNNVILTTSTQREIIAKVRAVCGINELSDFTEAIEISPGINGWARSKAAIIGKQYGDFIVASQETILSPNPAADFLNVTSHMMDEMGRIDFYTVTGERLLSEPLMSNKENHLIDIAHLPDGIYLSTISINNQVIDQQKIVVAR